MADTTAQSRHAVAAAILDVCHRLEAKGLVSATDGEVRRYIEQRLSSMGVIP